MAETLIDTTQLKRLAGKMRTFDPEASRRLRAGLRAAGNLVAADARRRAGWSRRIPASIKVTIGTGYAKVTAGSAAAPHAAPYEHEGDPGMFRHPVFAPKGTGRESWTWVNQAARPFLHPANEASADQSARLIGDELYEGLVGLLD